MRLGVMSDLHCEFDATPSALTMDGAHEGHPSVGPRLVELQNRIDLLILAGDIHIGMQSMVYASLAADYLGCPVAFVAGNHEYYHHVIDELQATYRDAAALCPNVYFLENDILQLEIGGKRLRVLGCTLWTDYALYADGAEAVTVAMDCAQSRLSDHQVIAGPGSGRFRAADALLQHRRSLDWLTGALAAPHDGPTVVVTHHAVSELSVPDKHKGETLSAAFSSNLDELVAASGAELWVHGHTHHDVDYELGATRVLSRQRGYPFETDERFSPAIVEL